MPFPPLVGVGLCADGRLRGWISSPRGWCDLSIGAQGSSWGPYGGLQAIITGSNHVVWAGRPVRGCCGVGGVRTCPYGGGTLALTTHSWWCETWWPSLWGLTMTLGQPWVQ